MISFFFLSRKRARCVSSFVCKRPDSFSWNPSRSLDFFSYPSKHILLRRLELVPIIHGKDLPPHYNHHTKLNFNAWFPSLHHDPSSSTTCNSCSRYSALPFPAVRDAFCSMRPPCACARYLYPYTSRDPSLGCSRES